VKVGDLVKSLFAPRPMGVVVNVCHDVVTTVDVLVGDKVIYDQRMDLFEVVSESR